MRDMYTFTFNNLLCARNSSKPRVDDDNGDQDNVRHVSRNLQTPGHQDTEDTHLGSCWSGYSTVQYSTGH